MSSYSKERKEAIIRKMMPACNKAISVLSKESGIPYGTLYTWRKNARQGGVAVPGNGKNAEEWSTEDKFSVVLETSALNEAEVAEYCRKKGLYVDQINTWRRKCIQANGKTLSKKRKTDDLKDKKRIKNLEKELHRKEKALAETTALLVLRKKANAIWGEGEDD